jgi:hypothetical protein
MVGIGAITAASLVLGWALLTVAEVGRRRAPGRAATVALPNLVAPYLGPQPRRVGRVPNTLPGMNGAPTRRRRDPVSGQVPLVMSGRPDGPMPR